MSVASVTTIISLAKKNRTAGIISLCLYVMVAIILTCLLIVCGIDYATLKVDVINEYDLQVIEEQYNCCGWKGMRTNCISDVGMRLRHTCYAAVGSVVVSMVGVDTFLSALFLFFTLFLIFVSYQSVKSQFQEKPHFN